MLVTQPFGATGGTADSKTVWIPPSVASRLRTLGLEQPIALDDLPGKWWLIHADLAALGKVSEPGCGYAQTIASTEDIGGHYGNYWMEILGGPFEAAEDGDAVYLASQGTDVSWLGAAATVNRVSPWIARSLIARGLCEPVPLTRLSGMYWVCGLGGGCCSTAELDSRIRSSAGSVDITHGPFEHEEDAQYAFDVMWESPE